MGEAKVGLPLFIWKVIQLINNTRKHFCVFTTVSLRWPRPVCFLLLTPMLLRNTNLEAVGLLVEIVTKCNEGEQGGRGKYRARIRKQSYSVT